MQTALDKARRIVIKLGTGILTSDSGEIDVSRIEGICREIAHLAQLGLQVVVVSSGAVGLGMGRLGLVKRPTRLPELQKCAAVGQSILTETWQQGFRPYEITVAQILLTGSDITQPSHNRIFGEFLEEVISSNVIPIVNENDCVSTDGFSLGDNDSLAALVACRIRADLLVILSTIPGLMDLKTNTLVRRVDAITADIEALAEGTPSATSVGGMLTKIRAARMANAAGCGVFIGSGYEPTIIRDIIEDKAIGTFFAPGETSVKSRKRFSQKRWKLYFSQAKGTLVIDSGAQEAIIEQGSSLLATGIITCKGEFAQGDVIDIKTESGALLARGVSTFDSDKLAQIAGKKSEDITRLFPDVRKTEVIHRDSLVLLS